MFTCQNWYVIPSGPQFFFAWAHILNQTIQIENIIFFRKCDQVKTKMADFRSSGISIVSADLGKIRFGKTNLGKIGTWKVPFRQPQMVSVNC